MRAGDACGAAYTNRIHRDDCAGILHHLLRLDRPLPLYLGADHEPATQCSVMDWIAGRLGLPAPARSGSDAAVAGKRCRNARLVASGYAFEYPGFRDGYGAMIGDPAGEEGSSERIS